MKKLLLVALSAITGSVLTVLLLGIPPTVRAGVGAPTCSSRNGDVNADGQLDLADAITLLGHLFLGDPTELVPNCEPPELTAQIQELETQLFDCRAGNSTGLPDTGQTQCAALLDIGRSVSWPCFETNCPGQDAEYTTGCSSQDRFVDNGDGTVSDTCTGLLWQKDMADTNGDGQSNSFLDRVDWCRALNYCEGLSLAGHDDWRLPNVRELQSIVNYGSFGSALDEVFGTSSDWHWYWSSTTYADDFDHSWYVDFYSGFVYHDGKTFNFNVRAVRTGP